MDQQTVQPSGSYKSFGIISLILGILAFLFSFIPCLGIYAVFPGILGIVFGVIGLILANKVNGAKGMVIAGVVLSILGTAVASWQYKKINSAVKELDKVLIDTTEMNEFKNSMDSSLKALDSSVNALDSVK